jgi:predicted AAA+ superfamily ATPase
MTGNIRRPYWHQRMESAWAAEPLLWLQGLRGVGKTTLCKGIKNSKYLDCESPRGRAQLKDPRAFFSAHRKKRIVFDEIRFLNHPAAVLKIAATEFPELRLLFTGWVGAKAPPRCAKIIMTPSTARDAAAFGIADIDRRLLQGGLPQFLLGPALAGPELTEWLAIFWANDIEAPFRIQSRDAFLHFIELLLISSGRLFEAARFAAPCKVSRPTIVKYLAALESTFAASVLRPFSTRRGSEIIGAPKVYGFDSAFACYYSGSQALTPGDRNILWEHLVLNELQAAMQTRAINYWRDKRGHEVQFVLPDSRAGPTSINCLWSARHFDARAIRSY